MMHEPKKLLYKTFTREERGSLLGYSLFIAGAHLLGWGALVWLSIGRPQLLALGALAYGFGLRHAFDADHIAAIDNVTRKLLSDGANPLGTGFYFSLGHSSVVFAVAVGLGLFAQGAVAGLSVRLAHIGGVIGTAISGVCLLLIGIMNLVVLIRLWRGRSHGAAPAAALDSEGARIPRTESPPGGLLTRLFGRFLGTISRSRQMYAVGALFGLGFDTASEIALLALSAASIARGWPLGAAMTLPILFAAGMGLIDTSDGVLMAKAYAWSSRGRRRGGTYNLAVTALSVCLALVIGTIELAHLPTSLLAHIDMWTVGAAITVLFGLIWLAAAAVQARRQRRLDRSADEL